MRRTEYRVARALLALMVPGFLLLSPVTVGELSAQGWDTPRHLSPASQPSMALAWTRFPESQGSGEGVVGSWRPSGWGPWLGIRAGAVFNGANPRGMAGVDLSVPVVRRGPWRGGWMSGLGLSVGSLDTRVTLPVQLAVSHSWSSGQVWAAPYLSGGVALEWNTDPASSQGDFRHHPVVEVGADLSLDPGRTVLLRVGWSVVGRRGLSLGVGLNRR